MVDFGKEELRPMTALAVPVVLAELGWMGMGVVDTMVVGRVGAEAIGAVSLGRILFFAVVVFAGTNDIHPGNTKPPEQLLATYQRFIAKVRADLPDAPIYYIAITPSPLRWEVWDIAQQANQLIAEYSEREPGLFVIDTGPSLLGADGTPNRDNYVFDGLHLSEAGYAIWTELIRERLLADLGA